jgi:hypothetical protein
MIFSGTGKGQKAFSDEELRDQMRKNKLTSLFKNYTEEEQTKEYKDAAAELARRQRAKETASQKGSESRTTVATPTASRPSVSGTQAQVAAAQKPTVGGTKAPTTQKAPAPTQQTGAGVEGVGKPSVTSTGKPATTETGTSATQGEPGVSSNILLPGIVAAGLYGTKKAIEKFERVRGTGEGTKPSVAKPTEVKAPTEKVTPSTIEGKPVAKGKPSVADRAAMGRDALRAGAPGEIKTGTSFEIPRAGVDYFYNTKYSPESWQNIVDRLRGVEITTPPETSTWSPKSTDVVQSPPLAEPRRRGESLKDVDKRTLQRLEKERPGSTSEVKPTIKPSNVGSEVSSRVGKIGKGTLGTATTIGAAIGGEIAVEKALETAGVEDETVKGILSPTIGWAAGEGALATGMGLARGLGLGAAMGLGAAAAWPAAIFGSLAYPSAKAAEASQAAMEKESKRISKSGSATKAKFIGPKY